MSDFESLKSNQSFAGALLRSASADAPSARARRLAAASLGMVATASVVPSALAAGQALGTTTAQVVVPAGVKSVGVAAVSKWLVSSFVVGAVASGGAITAYEVISPREIPALAQRAARPPPRASNKPAAVSQQVSAAPAPEPATIVEADAGTPEPAPRVAPQRKFGASRHPRPVDAPSLDEEIAWLEPARRSLRAKDGGQALKALDRATPHVRLLASEAALLRVEALLLVGRRAEAERLARPFLDRHAQSPHAERLRRLLGEP